MTTMSALTLSVRISTKDQQLIKEIDSSLQSVSWDLVTHKHDEKAQREDSTFYLDLNTSNRDYSISLEKLVSLLHTMQSLNSNGLSVLDTTLDAYCRTARRLGSTFEEVTEDGGWTSVRSPQGTR